MLLDPGPVVCAYTWPCPLFKSEATQENNEKKNGSRQPFHLVLILTFATTVLVVVLLLAAAAVAPKGKVTTRSGPVDERIRAAGVLVLPRTFHLDSLSS